ncbi:MAG: hypothetical protein KGL39_49500 [Patescibacteria group bacterium]|nr:hypothetical protein [Patescibacteria group bacterium]
MAKLTAEERKHLKPKQFAGPGRTFPVNDKPHDRAAIRMAPKSYNAGNISKSTEQHIVTKARHALNSRLGVLPRKHVSRSR